MRAKSAVIKGVVYLAAIVTFALLIAVIGHVFIEGVPNLSPDLFAWKYTSDNQSMMPAIINTLSMIGLTLLSAVPIGVFTAVYLVEYAKGSSLWVKIVRVTAETLQGIPSIIYGLFGMLFFGNVIGWSYTLLSGALTMSIMCLPLIMRATEEALMSVPSNLREASFGLGARKLRTIFRIVLPTAVPGILSGIILAIGRVFGETAALMFTSGSMAQVAGLFESGRTLALHMYFLSTEGLHRNEAYATAVVLVIVAIIINALSSYLASRVQSEGSNE